MIEDEELRTLFGAESDEHLARLEQDLLRLEQDPTDAATLEEAFREAHSLKGASRMLGLGDIELLSHRLESLLRTAFQDGRLSAGTHTEPLLAALDTLKALCGEAVSGQPAPEDWADVLEGLGSEDGARMGRVEARTADSTPIGPQTAGVAQQAVMPSTGTGRGDKAPATPPAEAKVGRVAVRTADPPPMGQQANGVAQQTAIPPTQDGKDEAKIGRGDVRVADPSPTSDDYRIDTLRVPTRRLDTLMSLTGDLRVAQRRLARRLADLDDILGTVDLGDAQAVERLRVGLREDNAHLEGVAASIEHQVRKARLLPLSHLFDLFPRTVRDLAETQGKRVHLETEGGTTSADKRILEEMKDPLMHLLRNALDHGIETPEERRAAGKPEVGRLWLAARRDGSRLVLEVADDGRGLDGEAIRRKALAGGLYSREALEALGPAALREIVFSPGFSTSERVTNISVRGIGLDVVRDRVGRLKGTLDLASTPGQGCRIRISLPTTLITSPILLVRAAGRTFGIPAEAVSLIRRVAPSAQLTLEGRPAVDLDGAPVALARLTELLGLADSELQSETGHRPPPCLLLSTDAGRGALWVDAVLDQQELVVKPLGALLRRVRNVSGVTILSSGEPCCVLDPRDLVRTLRRPGPRLEAAPTGSRLEAAPTGSRLEAAPTRLRVLLAEDSLTIRVQEKRILEGAGYQVVVAVDGLDALEKLALQPVDALVSDIRMPRLDGLGLTARVRRDPRYAKLPVILVTTLDSDEDRQRGLEVGANAYISKSAFDPRALLDALERLV